MRTRRALKLAAASASVLVWCAPALGATPRWSSSVPVANDVSFASLGIDGAGGVTVLWEAESPRRVLLSTASADATAFSTPAPLGTEGSVEPEVAVTESGEAIALWQQLNDDDPGPCEFGPGTCPRILRVRIRPPGGAFGPEQTVAPRAFFPAVAMNDSGAAVLVWQTGGIGGAIQMSVRKPGGPFGPVRVLAPLGTKDETSGCTPSGFRTAAAINDRGDAIVTWQYYDCDADRSWASYRSAGERFGAPEALPAGDSQSLSLAPDGTTTLAFARPLDAESDTAMIIRAPDGQYGAVRSIGPRGDPQLTTNGAGATLFWWEAFEAGAFQTRAVFRRPTGEVEEPFAILPHGAHGATFALDELGNVLGTWMEEPSKGQAFRGTTFTRFGVAETPQRIGGEDPAHPEGLVVNDAGAAAAAFVEVLDLSTHPPPSRLVVIRRSADNAAPELQGSAAETMPRKVLVETSCDEVCRVRSTASVRGSPHAARKKVTVTVRTGWKVATTGQSLKQSIRIGRKKRRRMRRLLKSGAPLTAIATIRAQDASGNARTVRRKISLVKLLGS